MPTLVYSTTIVDGLHNWPGAIPAVHWLAFPHRHRFVIKAFAEVGHDDRDVEFIILGQAVRATLEQRYATPDGRGMLDFRHESCEMIGRHLVEALGLVACIVSEDGENGAVVVKEGLPYAVLPTA